MTVLSILRHAKSSWGEAEASDFDRPLNDRGRQAAERMGQEFKQRGVHFDHILASPAVRVRETLDCLARGFGALPVVIFEESLYAASEMSLLALTKSLPGDVHAPLIVGHNPGLHKLLLALTSDDAEGLRGRIAGKFPTAGFATVNLPAVRWVEVVAGSGRISALILPRELD